MSTYEYKDAFERGQNNRRQGLYLNPYLRGTVDFLEWDKGWVFEDLEIYQRDIAYHNRMD